MSDLATHPVTDHPEWIKQAEIPKLVPVGRTTVARMIESGDLPAVRFGKTVLIKYTDFLAAFRPVA
ncbi:MAG: excisionase family DNA-binding protein [Rhodococcus sp.]|nr:excisionase family DNA-binding protein [Rhodococcus sp. (in: high G+C Gram-positive bacteria)]